MMIRSPVWNGRFYPADPGECRQLISGYFQRTPLVPSDKPWIAGLVPHAGWICSAAIAAETLAAIARTTRPDIVVVFGAIHTPLPLRGAALDSHDAWGVPTGSSIVHEEAAARLLEFPDHFRTDDRFHQREHAIEVELPLIQHSFPKTTILPIEIAPDGTASTIGHQTAQLMKRLNLKPIFLASSDLTHYGPDYRFTPAGIGPAALQWAMENDRRLLDLTLQLADTEIIPEVATHLNACGAGAIAATIAAAREFGASSAHLISHTNSFQTLRNVAPQPPTHSVGYASLVIG
ncbi:MAG TPA: AmmeMemoRadiSam system protein B [Tepidisphaeraceae bacterium]